MQGELAACMITQPVPEDALKKITFITQYIKAKYNFEE